jgi:hypothetical protein
MGKTFSTGLLTNGLWQDSSNNIGIGAAANASFKLQVTGATNLTGALTGGAVATFTAAANPLILKSTAATTMYTEYYYNTSTLSGYIGNGSGILTGANNSDFIVRSEADLVLATGNNRRMTIASSTGAATFSSSVRVNNANDIARLSVFGTSGNPSMTADTNNLFSITGNLGPQLNIGGYNGASYGMWLQVKDANNSNINYPILLQPLGGSVAIGTASPSALLHLAVANAAVDGTKGVKITNPAGTTVMLECGVSSDSFVGTTSASDFSIRTGNSERMKIFANGNVAIQNTFVDNGSKLNITSGAKGAMRIITDATYDAISIGGTGAIRADYPGVSGGRFELNDNGTLFLRQYAGGTLSISSGQVVSSSDINLKNDDGGIDNALSKILNLNPRYFYWKEDSGIETTDRQLGFYAQEVQEALGIEVANKNSNEKWGIYDRGIIAMLTKAIQELTQKVNALENK